MSKETGGQAFPRQQWEYDGQNNVLQYQEETGPMYLVRLPDGTEEHAFEDELIEV